MGTGALFAAFREDLGTFFGASGGHLSPFWCFSVQFGHCGATLVIFWGAFGHFGAALVLLGGFWAPFGAFGDDCGHFWCFWGRFGPLLVLLW